METAYLGKCNITYGKGEMSFITLKRVSKKPQHNLSYCISKICLPFQYNYFYILFRLTIFLLFLLIKQKAFCNGKQGGLIHFVITWAIIHISEEFFHWYVANDVLFLDISHNLMLKKVA